ncbi:sphingoid long chain base kinase 4 [Hortaea werneckii]|nr:sphingoid long chain base kinase 4 [Hortaea werneckii]KAI7001504.1 sphingoid long chain base kinase 4 [Hortaea werneckii]KAI7140177.1 sphingoid long chain base kinase 4 [Hortaea werneckii]KAI7177711.1 sphingoid long chain base kinase 4 [Hortaea werneckii]
MENSNNTATRDTNPFDDPAGPGSEASPALDAAAVLTVDRNATLTLGTDALIVLDEGLKHKRGPGNCCGFLPQFTKTTRAIPFYNILWTELNDFDVTVRYAQPSGKQGCKVGYINYTVTDKSMHAHAKRWVDALLDRAYPSNVKRRKRIKVLVNPYGGQGQALKFWTREAEPILAAARCEVDVEKTGYRGHATEIAEKLDPEGVDVVACASGDGLPHEVFNGLAKQKNARRALRKVAVTQLPCGSGNGMSLNLNGTNSPSLAAVAIVKGIRSPMDLVAITQGEKKYYSFLSQAVGIVAESDLGTESLRWMGSLRFTWGFLVRLLGQTVYPAEISLVTHSSDKQGIRQSYRSAAQEQQNMAAENIPPYPEDEALLESAETDVPPLQYGTVNDKLPSDFETQDNPTLGNFYVGKMCWMSPDAPFFPTSLPADGLMDMVSIDGTIPRTTSISMLTSVEQGKLMDFGAVDYRKLRAYRISPRQHQSSQGLRAKMLKFLGGAGQQTEGLISIDGEKVPFEPFQAEVVPGLATVISKRGALYEYDMPREQ